MRPQYEKNKEYLEEKIEEYMNRPMTDSIAEHLSAYHGALKALCMMDKQEGEAAAMTVETPAEKAARTPELDGDTEFEKILMEIPIDAAHVKAVYNIFADHMEQLDIMHHKAYEGVMMKLREVARH